MQNTKIAIVLRNDLAPWQALNVTAFLATGLAAQHPDMMGEPYVDREGNRFNRLAGQPVIVLAADEGKIGTIHRRAIERGVTASAYTEEMFSTSHDAANREVFAEYGPEDARIVGIALRDEAKTVDRITRGARMHP
jgi:hypothetical protein